MKATRFAMSLYLSFPVLASACSVVMIGHFILLAEGRIAADGRYGDMYTYIALAEHFNFFSGQISSFRILSPLISGSIAGLFSLSGVDSIGLLTGSLNFAYLLLGFGLMFHLSLKEKNINSLEVALPIFILLSLPAFWHGIFLPVPDALLFCTFALVLLAVIRKQTLLLLISIITGTWVSEWLFLALFLLPLFDYIRGSAWKTGYAVFAAAAALYLAVPLYTVVPDAHLVYRPLEWLQHTTEQFSHRETGVIAAFFQSFALALPFIGYRFYVTGWNKANGSLLFWFLLLFFIIYAIEPDKTNRILFMAMPSLVLWQYHLETFRTAGDRINGFLETNQDIIAQNELASN